MNTRAFGLVTFIVAACLPMTGACDKSPTQPPPGTARVLTVLTVVGPARIAPGESVRFGLTASWSDGTTSDVSNEVAWASSNPSVAQVDPSGNVLGHERGVSVIRGSYQQRTATKSVMVMPPGTYRVSGRVTETGIDVPLAAAKVEAASVPDRVETVTTAAGAFDLFGVAADAELRVTKDGYVPYAQSLRLSSDSIIEVALTLAGPRLDISGTYTLRVGSPDCSDPNPLAPEFRQRTYTATITQTANRAHVTLTGGDFAGVSNRLANTFWGTVTASGATFNLNAGDWYYSTIPEVVERLSNGTFLSITGTATTRASASGLTGTLDGQMLHAQTLPSGPWIGACTSEVHVFTLSR